MNYEIRQVQVEEQPTAVVRGHATRAGIAQFLDEVFREVWALSPFRVAAPLGRRSAATTRRQMASGWRLASPPTRQCHPRAGSRPLHRRGARQLSVLHHGEYADLPAAYRAAEAWVAEHNWESTGMPWESYLDGPEVAGHRTAVYWPARPRWVPPSARQLDPQPDQAIVAG